MIIHRHGKSEDMKVGLAFKEQRLLAGRSQKSVFGAVVLTMLLSFSGQLYGLTDRILLAGFIIEVSLGIVGQDRQAGHGRKGRLNILPVGGLEKIA